MTIVSCPECGVDRWFGTGPCGSCGARMFAPADEQTPPPAPSPLAVPDTVRRLVWEVADALGDEVVEVFWRNGLVVVLLREHMIEMDRGDCDLFDNTGQHRVGTPLGADDPLDRLAIEVESWASSLVAQAVTDGDWGRPA